MANSKSNNPAVERLKEAAKGDPNIAATVKNLSDAELAGLAALMATAAPSSGGDALSNPAPAVETGPHLNDPEIRKIKRKQMRDAGLSADDESLTDDMRKILREKDED